MEDKDQPLGAPNLGTENQHAEPNQQQQPPKPKRKLNWKGFGFGIIAVIVIEFFAVSMLNSPDPELPIAPPNESTKEQQLPRFDPPADWQTHISSESAYTFKYPPTWDTHNLDTNLLMVAPQDRINELRKISGGFGGGKFLTITIQERNTPYPNNYFKSDNTKQVAQKKLRIDNASAVEYVTTYTNTPGPGIAKGDVITTVIVTYKNKQYSLELLDKSHKQTFDQILATFKFTNNQTTPSAAPVTECTNEAMQCPDGTSVGRTGPNCEFVCPKAN
jgi:hypothetical protein